MTLQVGAQEASPRSRAGGGWELQGVGWWETGGQEAKVAHLMGMSMGEYGEHRHYLWNTTKFKWDFKGHKESGLGLEVRSQAG